MYIHNTAYGFQNIQANATSLYLINRTAFASIKQSAKAYSQFTDLMQKAGEFLPSINQELN